ncbi:hypothetical protein J4211_05345 [Candidatus Woesearchaeota archaeon]|nr:hypothetical protein [Candidatus Woesearchaeota archaeon]
MASIPWWAWLGVGAFVAITSAGVGGKLKMFAWVGLLFIVIGIAKAVYIFVLQEREESTPKHTPVTSPRQHILFCPRCRAQAQVSDYFCRLCGLRLR